MAEKKRHAARRWTCRQLRARCAALQPLQPARHRPAHGEDATPRPAAATAPGAERSSAACSAARLRPPVPPSSPASAHRPGQPQIPAQISRYAATEVSWPGHRATVLVALAWTGSIFMPSMAGNTRNDPPPATAFSMPPRNDSHGQPHPMPVDRLGELGSCAIPLDCTGRDFAELSLKWCAQMGSCRCTEQASITANDGYCWLWPAPMDGLAGRLQAGRRRRRLRRPTGLNPQPEEWREAAEADRRGTARARPPAKSHSPSP